MQIILVPALITLAITLLRLVGELQNWSPSLFNKTAGGGGALIGIVWLIPIFAIYFALKLSGRGEGPASAGKALGIAFLALLITVAVAAGVAALKLPSVAMAVIFTVVSWICTIMALRAWPALGKTLLAYAFAARIPVVIVMLVAILGNWGTHYDVAPPNNPEVVAMGPLAKWFWIGVVPQMTAWIFVTVVLGMIVGSLTAMIVRKRSPATA
jgi:hypothetical protein